MLDRFVCFACGYPDLAGLPWDNDSSSDEICPSCGIHFGHDDAAGGDPARREEIHREWRRHWIVAGMKWWSLAMLPPDGTQRRNSGPLPNDRRKPALYAAIAEVSQDPKLVEQPLQLPW